VASTENTGVQGTDTSTHEHPTIANSLSALVIAEYQEIGSCCYLRAFFSCPG
jgi:hypothetical protein